MHSRAPSLSSRTQISLGEGHWRPRAWWSLSDAAGVVEGPGQGGVCHCCGSRPAFRALCVCVRCFCAVEALPFFGCARCGRRACAGACGELAPFQSVSVLFTYAPPLSTLLLQAKNDACPQGQQAFRHLFFLRIQRALEGLVARHGVSRVVLAPLRVSRLWSLEWHPHALFLEALEDLRSRGWPLEVEVPLKAGWVRQASRAASDRRREASRLLRRMRPGPHHGALPEDAPMNTPTRRNRGGVLVVDDVLTSGQTALTAALSRGARRAPESPPDPLHLFALLRTPVETP